MDVAILCLVAIVVHVQHLIKIETSNSLCDTFHPRERLLLPKPTRLLMDPQAQDDNELEATEYHQYTHEMFFQSLSLPSSQSGSFALTNNSAISEGTKV